MSTGESESFSGQPTVVNEPRSGCSDLDDHPVGGQGLVLDDLLGGEDRAARDVVRVEPLQHLPLGQRRRTTPR